MISKVKLKYFLSVLVVFSVIGIGLYVLFYKTLSIQIEGNVDGENVVFQANDAKLKEIKSETKTFVKAKDYSTTYEVSSRLLPRTYGQLTVTVRKLDNGDFFVFTKFQNDTKQSIILDLSFPFEQGFSDYEVTRFHSEKIVHEHDTTLGVDPTSTPHGLIELKGQKAYANLVVSKNYNSVVLTEEYNQEQKSQLRELIAEHDGTEITKKGESIVLHMPHFAEGQSLSESWMLHSDQRLFNKKENFEEWEKHTLKEYKKINKWYTADGPYGKLPWSIEPGTKLGYGRYFSLVHDRRHVDHYEKTKERYFYDFIVNSAANLLVYESKLNKPIHTEITSTWLKDNYGIIAPYYDTRFNEYLAIHLKRISKLLNVPEYDDMSIFYAEYLVDQVEKKNFMKTDHGYIISDFYGSSQKKRTHASLNHALGEMNFLLDSYQKTKKEEFLTVAFNIKKGIEDIGVKWIKDNKDLWYQLNPDFTFHGKDYPLLTLEDLLKAQEKLEQVDLKRSPTFDQLITSKTQYLVNDKIEITRKVITSLKEQGFGYLVKDYPHITDY